MSTLCHCNLVFQDRSSFDADRLAYDGEISTLRENLDKMRKLEQEIKQKVSSDKKQTQCHHSASVSQSLLVMIVHL